MECFYCKGQIEDKSASFMAEVDDRIVVIKNVPSQVCRQCGEVSYSRVVALQLEEMVKRSAQAAAELSIASYADLAA